jgi:hypothetical protein
MDGRQAIVAKFEDEDSAGFEVLCGLCNQVRVKFAAFFAAVEGGGRLMFADFARERLRFAATDVRRVAGNQIKEQ